MYSTVSGHNATDKMPMYEMPLNFVFGGWVLWLGEHFLYWGFGCWHFVIGILSLPFCPKIVQYLQPVLCNPVFHCKTNEINVV